MIDKFLIGFLTFVLLIPVALAVTNQTCLTPALLNTTTIIITNGTPTTIFENVTCVYGCERSINGTARCLEISEGSFSIPFIWISGTVLFGLLGFLIQNKDLSLLRIIFFFASIWMLLNSMGIALNLAHISSFGSRELARTMVTGIKVVNTVTFASFALFFLVFVINLVKWLATIKSKKRFPSWRF